MKLKFHLVITDPEAFLRGDYTYSLHLYTENPQVDAWSTVGQIEVDINPDTQKLTEQASAEIDAELSNARAKVQLLERRKSELVALPAPAQDAGRRQVGDGLYKDQNTGRVVEDASYSIHDDDAPNRSW